MNEGVNKSKGDKGVNKNEGDEGVNKNEDEEFTVILTPPLSLDYESVKSDYRAPNLIQRIFSLLKNVRPGSDVTRFSVCPFSVYC